MCVSIVETKILKTHFLIKQYFATYVAIYKNIKNTFFD